MNDLLTPDAIEDRLRRTLRIRAEDMAPGDLPASDGGEPGLPVLPTLPGSDGKSDRSTGRGRVLLVAAALLLLLGGAAAVVVIAQGDGGGDRVTNSPAATTTTSDGGPDPGPDQETDGGTDTEAEAIGPPDGSYAIGEYEGDGYRIHAQFDAGVTPESDSMTQSELSEPVQAGDHEGFYTALPNGSISELHLVVDGGMVVLRGGPLPRDQLIAAGATVTLDPSTGLYTMPAPPGWTTVWTTPPDWNTPDPEAADDAEPLGIGHLVDPAAPGTHYAYLIWYRGWDGSNLPEGVTQIEVGDQTAYVGSIAPEFDEGLQLWLFYDDGAVELQGVGLSREELIAIAGGIHRTPGTDDFEVTPPPGFQSADP